MKISINANEFNSKYNFVVNSLSNILSPNDNSLMYVTNKIKGSLINLKGYKNCIVFVEESMEIDEELKENNLFYKCTNPALEYAHIVNKLVDLFDQKDPILNEHGYYCGKDVKIGKNTKIEPQCCLENDVIIGNNCTIQRGAIIKSGVRIGNDCFIGNYTIIGDYGFVFVEDESGKNIRIRSIGGVVIGDNVNFGSNSVVCAGTSLPTIIKNNVRIDGCVFIGHDVILEENVSIAAQSVMSGYVHVGKNTIAGVSVATKNRISIGSNVIIGAGAVVIKDTESDITIVGNPTRVLLKKQ